MEMNDAGYALLKSFEKCVLKAYQDEAGVWTQGWGHTGPEVIPGSTWSEEISESFLERDVQRTVDDLLDMIEPELSDNQFSALVCMAFNIGSHAFEGSSALLLVNEGRLVDVPAAMMKWVKVRIDGVLHVSRGLVRRRKAEVSLWNLG